MSRTGTVLYCSEIKGTNQLHSYCEADLHLCFRICETQSSHDAALVIFYRIWIGKYGVNPLHSSQELMPLMEMGNLLMKKQEV